MIKDEKLSEIMNEINENLKLNNFRDACSLAKVANDISPNNFQILLIIATCYQQMDNVNSAIRNNIFGTKSVLKSAKKYNIPIVTISTDKAVRPTSILGLTKRISEILCLKYNKNNFSSKVVRFGNVCATELSFMLPRKAKHTSIQWE